MSTSSTNNAIILVISDACDGTPMMIDDSGIVISSPNYDNNYPNNQECQWAVTAPSGQVGYYRKNTPTLTGGWSHQTGGWSHKTGGWSHKTRGWSHKTGGWSHKTDGWSHKTDGWSHKTDQQPHSRRAILHENEARIHQVWSVTIS